jgi:hypothetical protein
VILYKYARLDVVEKIIENNGLAFSKPTDFNDPFDIPTNPPVPASHGSSEFFSDLRGQLKSDIWNNDTAILCLTRNWTNQLMWAHYADCHRGAVVGINAGTAGFLDEATNLIPAHFGSVIYSRHRNADQFNSTPEEPVSVGNTHKFVVSHYEKWQRLFLTKPLDWAYEEEVRVVKCINGLNNECRKNESGIFSMVKTDSRQRYVLSIPDGSISEVIFGVRAEERRVAEIRKLQPSLSYYKAVLDHNRYAVERNELRRI